MDGYKFIRKFRFLMAQSCRPTTLIAAITGHAESDFFSKVFRVKADHVYSKPISSDKV